MMDFTESAPVKELSDTAYELWLRGCHEASGGNITMRLTPEQSKGLPDPDEAAQWASVASSPLPSLAGAYFLATAGGSRFRTLRHQAQKTLGVIQMDHSGARYRTVWGFCDGGKPTSELPVHVQVHATRHEKTSVVIHSHPTNLVALSCLLRPNSVALTRLLWGMHGECVVFFPNGIEYLPFRMSGREDAGTVAAEALKKRNMLLWQFHGIFAAGPDLETVFDLIEAADKAAEIYLKVTAAGGPDLRLSLEQARVIADSLGIDTDPQIMGF